VSALKNVEYLDVHNNFATYFIWVGNMVSYCEEKT
jgi:hypothetical protein